MILSVHYGTSLVEIGVDRNTSVVFPTPLMSTIGELGSFLAREPATAAPRTPSSDMPKLTAAVATPNGGSDTASTPAS